MPTWGATAAGAAAAATSSGLGAGLGPHCPVGTWSGTTYRSILRWGPPSWNAWTSISKATLRVKTTDFAHVGPRNSTILVRRQDVSGLWTIGSGSQNCNSGFSGSNTTQYADMASSASGQSTFQSGTTENAWKTIDVTAQIQYYWAQRSPNIVLVLAQSDNTDYSEFWSDDAASGNVPTLQIDYVDASPPNAPTLLSPAASPTTRVQTRFPTFTWDHVDPQGDPQLNAEVQLYDSGGVAIGAPAAIAGAAETYTWPSSLTIGATYQWSVRTQDLTGWGPFATKRTFKVQGGPQVFFNPPTLEWGGSPGAPRIRLNFYTWSDDVDQGTPNSEYTIEYPIGTTLINVTGLNSTVFSVLLDAFAIADNTSYAFRVRCKTVGVPYADGFADTTVKPRIGLSSHHKLISPTPSQWLSATATFINPIPAGATHHEQFGSSASSSTTPDAWVDDLSQVTPNPHFFWRTYLMAGSGGGPTLDKMIISSLGGAPLDLDKWTTDATFPTTDRPKKPHAFAAPWSVDQSEYVYGSRSVSIAVAGAGPYQLWQEQSIRLRANRSYILTGLMKSIGNSGASFEVQDATGTVLAAQGFGPPAAGPMRSPVLVATTTFYGSNKDLNRYRTPVLTVGGSDIDVYVVLKAGGTAGSRAYFDAIKLEESTVAAAWSPGALGSSIVDSGGVQIDASKGGVLRLKGSDAAARSTVELGTTGLLFAGDTRVASPSAGVLSVNEVPVGTTAPPILRFYSASGTWTRPPGLVALEVEVCGGGGGGGGAVGAGSGNAAGAGGGAGAYARYLYSAADLAGVAVAGTCAVAVGAAGSAPSGANGGAGGTSSFTVAGMTTLQGTGGAGGAVGPNQTGNGTVGRSAGGTASGPVGAVLADGASGSSAAVRGGAYIPGARGAASFFGDGGTSGQGGVGEAGQVRGSGGGGGTASSASIGGGAGASGVVIIKEFYA